MYKKISTLVCGALILLGGSVNAQSNRMVVIEEATQASCGPCAAANPGIKSLLESGTNPDKALIIAYQVWWPGFDPMYEDNEAEVDDRIGNYYSDITGAPNIVVQGSSGAQGVSYLTQSLIDNTNAEMSEFDLQISGEVVNGDMVITGSINCTDSVSGDLRLRLIVTEKTIYKEDHDPAGTNSETEYHHVFKKFVYGNAGYDMMDTWVPGDTMAISETFDLTTLNIYRYSELEIVAMIQNNDDKFIHQAAKDSDIPITVQFDNTAAASGVTEINALCPDATFTPEVTITNTGNDDLTSATITYDINGGASQTHNWTGTLTTLASEKVMLPAIMYSPSGGTDVLNVSVSMPNGMADDNTADDATSENIPAAPESEGAFKIEFTTDQYADETYIEVQNSTGTAIFQAGNPNVGLTNVGTGSFPPPSSSESFANNTDYVFWIPVDAIDCYTIYFSDYYGDGILGGGFTIEDEMGNMLVDNSSWGGTQEIDNVNAQSTGVLVEEINAANTFTVLSNPIVDRLDVTVDLAQAERASITMMDASGRTVLNEQLGQMPAGAYMQSFDLGSLAKGVYVVNFVTENNVITRKVVVGQ